MLPLSPVVAALVLPGLALAQQSSTSYGGTFIECPAGLNIVRHAGVVAVNQTISPEEATYIKTRREGPSKNGYATFLKSVQGAFPTHCPDRLPDYLVNTLRGTRGAELPKLGLALSGGGYRATIVGAGVLHAFDGRNTSSVAAGTGGLLQAADRVAGLSGGNWLLTSLAQANFPTIPTLAFGPSEEDAVLGGWGGWNAQLDLLTPADDDQMTNYAYYQKLLTDLGAKRASGFDVTFGDFWSRALSYHFLNGTTATNFFDGSASHGAGVLFTDITKTDSYQKFQQPFPIITTTTESNGQDNSQIIGSNGIPISNTMYELNPYEMGTWDRELSAFTPTKYLGTAVSGGRVIDTQACAQGFDQASFLTGTSSNIFPAYNTTPGAIEESVIAPFIQLINQTFGAFQADQQLDISAYPNPFYGLGTANYLDTDETELKLLDGGFTGAATPYTPLLVPAREVDVIIGVDANSDTAHNFVNGSSLIATQRRSQLFKGSYPFPKVPSKVSTYLDQGLSSRPTFFGCNEAPGTPLLVYLPNSPPLDSTVQPATNTTTDQKQYPNEQIASMLEQTVDFATRGFSVGPAKEDPLWSACLACAVVDRQRARQRIPRSGVCKPCFDRYCWNGKESSKKRSL